MAFYTIAYISEQTAAINNPRSSWYRQQHQQIKTQQLLAILLVLSFLVFVLVKHSTALIAASLKEFFWWLIFPVAGSLYYGFNGSLGGKNTLRQIGWLKPFVIGFCWAGVVTVYPVLFYNLSHQLPFSIEPVLLRLFIKNLMFIAVLCIMFDIKDYAVDHNQQVKTFVVQKGLRVTIFAIIIPLCLLGLGSFLLLAWQQHFPLLRIVLNTVPFICLLVVAFLLQQRRSIFFYLLVIDGLMLVKALCGSVGMWLT